MMASTQPNDQKYKLFFIPSGAWTLKGFGSDVQEHKEVIINILRYFTVGRLHERAKYSILIVLYVCMKPSILINTIIKDNNKGYSGASMNEKHKT